MAKKLFTRFLPSKETITAQKGFGIVKRWLHDSNLWQLNRRSASGAFAVGIWVAFSPVPFHMALSAVFAVWFRVNLPLSVALVWLVNPLTMPPIFYATYRLGSWFIQPLPLTEGNLFSWHWIKNYLFNWQWLTEHWHEVTKHLQAFLLGNLLCGTLLALLGYWGVRLLWRYSVARQWRQRRLQRKK